MQKLRKKYKITQHNQGEAISEHHKTHPKTG